MTQTLASLEMDFSLENEHMSLCQINCTHGFKLGQFIHPPHSMLCLNCIFPCTASPTWYPVVPSFKKIKDLKKLRRILGALCDTNASTPQSSLSHRHVSIPKRGKATIFPLNYSETGQVPLLAARTFAQFPRSGISRG